MAHLLRGRALAKNIRLNVKKNVDQLSTQPVLAVLLVGDDPASHTYVNLKKKACEEAGIGFELFLYPSDVAEETLIETIEELNRCEDVHGILVQLPLPGQNADRVIAALDPIKDVDGFHRDNLERLLAGEKAIAPAVALGIMRLITASQEPLREKKSVVVSSELFGKPLVALLEQKGCATEIVSPDDLELALKTKEADVLIVAVGRPHMIKKEYVKPEAVVIDVGTTKIEGCLTGDVDLEDVDSVAGWVTPVPGGVGPMTVAMLLVNILEAYRLQS